MGFLVFFFCKIQINLINLIKQLGMENDVCDFPDARKSGQMTKTNKPQKIHSMFFLCLLVLSLFLFSSGLCFTHEFFLIWFHRESLVLHISTKHLVYFLLENDKAKVSYRSIVL